MAFRHELLEAARFLIRKGADVDRVTANGETLPMVFLHQESSRMEYYTMLSAESLNDFDASSSDGYSALHYAALSGTAEDVAMLRRLGGDKMPTTEMNRTPLHSAATYGNASATEELCKYHLETGVDIRDSVGCTPLHRAIRFSSEEQRLKRFIPTDWTRCNNNPRVFHYHDTITTLLKAGADPATVVDWCRNHPYGCSCPSIKISTYEYAQRFGLETLRVFAGALEAAGKELPESYKVQLAETRLVEIRVDEVESEAPGRLTSSETEQLAKDHGGLMMRQILLRMLLSFSKKLIGSF